MWMVCAGLSLIDLMAQVTKGKPNDFQLLRRITANRTHDVAFVYLVPCCFHPIELWHSSDAGSVFLVRAYVKNAPWHVAGGKHN